MPVAPVWVRGLKQCHRHHDPGANSRTRMGAWIETHAYIRPDGYAGRRTRMGAWIETMVACSQFLMSSSRTRMGAWIETPCVLCDSYTLPRRTRMGAWIETCLYLQGLAPHDVAPVWVRGLKLLYFRKCRKC